MKRFRKIVVCLIIAALVCAAMPVYAAETQTDSAYGIATLAVRTSEYKTTWKGATYYHDPNVAAGKSILPGIDVSQYQGDINWSKVAADGVQFTFIRLGYTSQYDQSINLDPKFKANIEGAKAAGIKVGVYYRSQARTVEEAKQEANFTVEQLKSYSLDLPVAVDYEYYDGGTVTHSYPDKATKTAALNAFCDIVSAAGYRAVTYLNTEILTNDVNASDMKYGLWLARWTDGGGVPEYSGSYEFWQCCGGGAAVDGISGKVDLDWWYTNVTDIVQDSSGKWVYQENGKTDYTHTGVDQNQYGWWYVKDGVVDFSYTGFAQNQYGWWYIENGKVIFSTNSVIQGTVNGANAWWYVVGGKVQTSFIGLANYANPYGWWYIRNGKVDFSVNTVAQNNYGWWYVTEGKVQFGHTGVTNYGNDYGYWYVKNGKVDFSANTVAQNKWGWWYVTGGKVQFGHTGVANYANPYGWWYIKNGKVDFSVNTVAQNNYGWWYVKGGKVIFGYTGIAQNQWGWWYIKNGKVDFHYNGTVKDSGKTYSVTNGKVAK